MPRPRKNRCIGALPRESRFKPCGARWRDLETITLNVDGYEALRLADHEGLDHETAAERMGISQPTFSRLLAEARGTVAKVLVGGHALVIDGGNYHLAGTGDEACSCHGHAHGHGHGHGGGRHRHDHGISTDHSSDGEEDTACPA